MGLFTSSNSKTNETTTVSKGARVVGEIELNAKLHIDGEIDGKIISNNIVTVGKSGKVKGEIKAETLIVSGIVEGKCDVDIIEIMKDGKILGEIKMKNIVIEKGGIFEGVSSLKRKEEKRVEKENGK